jgi:hypothetical protein
VRLRLWPVSGGTPDTELDRSKVRLDIPHAVLCSEMGAHFSPCGRFLAACVACLPAAEASTSTQGVRSRTSDANGGQTAPFQSPECWC